MAPRIAAVILGVAILAACGHTQRAEQYTDVEEDKKSWKELEVPTPPYPRSENLVRLNTGTATPHAFYVDTSSITLSEDGIVRYTVVARMAGGATNVTFEGMRCETREQKLYATARADHTWVRARDTTWQRVLLRDLTPHHHTLYHEYFCPERTHPTPPRQAVDALKRGVGFRPRNESDG